jgi:hypothetical protein
MKEANLVHIPGGWQDYSKPVGACPSPKFSFFLDLGDQGVDRRLGTLEYAIVSMFPYHPGGEQHSRGEAFAKLLGSLLFSLQPPVHEDTTKLAGKKIPLSLRPTGN